MLIFYLNVMAICDRRHANMSKQTTTLADIDQTPNRGVPLPDASLLIKQYRRGVGTVGEFGH